MFWHEYKLVCLHKQSINLSWQLILTNVNKAYLIEGGAALRLLWKVRIYKKKTQIHIPPAASKKLS